MSDTKPPDASSEDFERLIARAAAVVDNVGVIPAFALGDTQSTT